MKKTITFLLLTTVSASFSAGCGEKVKPGVREVQREVISGLRTAVVVPVRINDYYETSGTVRAKTVSVISSRIMGMVTSVKVKEGDRVHAGQLLVSIDDSDMAEKVRAATEGRREAEKALEAARENQNLATITYERYRKLFDEKAISGQELDQIETQKKIADIDYERTQAAVSRAEAGLNEAKVFFGFTKITSPVSGMVTEKKIEIGSMAVPGMPLLTVEDASSYRIEVNVDEKLAGKIRPGTDAKVFIDSLAREISGSVTDVVPSIDPASRSSLVKIAVKGEGLKSGAYGKVSIPIGTKEVILLPRKAVVEKGQLTGVYSVDRNAVVKYRLVRTGKAFGDDLEIVSGLNADERVVVEDVERASDGAVLAGEK